MRELLSERVIAAANDVALSRGGLKSNYQRLFGTPERAARTLAGITCDDEGCEGCTLYDANCSYDENALLEWLRGESE